MLNFLKPRSSDHAPNAMQLRFPRHRIGRHSIGAPKLHDSGDGSRLEMGAFCTVGEGVHIFLGGEQPPEGITTFPFASHWPAPAASRSKGRSGGDVRIGNDVCIGFEAIIQAGVNIGDGAVIGMRAVVSKDVPAYAVVSGNPSQVMRFRFNETIIARLLKAQWWNWDDARISKVLPTLLGGDIDAFLAQAELSQGSSGGAA